MCWPMLSTSSFKADKSTCSSGDAALLGPCTTTPLLAMHRSVPPLCKRLAGHKPCVAGVRGPRQRLPPPPPPPAPPGRCTHHADGNVHGGVVSGSALPPAGQPVCEGWETGSTAAWSLPRRCCCCGGGGHPAGAGSRVAGWHVALSAGLAGVLALGLGCGCCARAAGTSLQPGHPGTARVGAGQQACGQERRAALRQRQGGRGGQGPGPGRRRRRRQRRRDQHLDHGRHIQLQPLRAQVQVLVAQQQLQGGRLGACVVVARPRLGVRVGGRAEFPLLSLAPQVAEPEGCRPGRGKRACQLWGAAGF